MTRILRTSNAYQPWSDEHDQELYFLKEVKHFTDDELAKHFQRTVGAIERRLRSLNDKSQCSSNNQFKVRAVLEKIEIADFFDDIVNGIDPNTGEEFNSDSVWMHPQIQLDIRQYMAA